jgi:hypothetical protein
MVNIDQSSGARRKREPLLTLSKYRRDGMNIHFGQFLMMSADSTDLVAGEDKAVKWVEVGMTVTPFAKGKNGT